MKFVRGFSILLVLILLLFTSITALSMDELQGGDDDYNEGTNQPFSSQEDEAIHGRILRQKKIKIRHSVMKCNKYPMICRAKGSPGPHCCRKKCVNVVVDRLNCGACGKRCKFNQICGKCVNPSFDRRHCGGCNNRCRSGGLCAFGLCNYA